MPFHFDSNYTGTGTNHSTRVVAPNMITNIPIFAHLHMCSKPIVFITSLVILLASTANKSRQRMNRCAFG